MKKFFQVTAPPLLIGTMLIASLIAAFAGSVALVAAQEIPRNETVQMSGYEGPPTALRPWDIAGQAGMAFFFMYEPLFGVNIAEGSAPEDLIKIVGESIEWVDDLTIEVKIRDEAKWTDGKPITSADVEYSYGVYGLGHRRISRLFFPALSVFRSFFLSWRVSWLRLNAVGRRVLEHPPRFPWLLVLRFS